mmetsp:Transcript_6770/g.9882  ORF Transcript_6770/g.9882 Transcript_6770/m.9882 type:complete len:235 (-) Transcript_6770:144-848(-)
MSFRLANKTIASSLNRNVPRVISTVRPPKSQIFAQQQPKNLRFLSTEEKRGIFGRLQDSFTDRQKASQQKMFAQQVEKMSNAKAWTLADFADDLEKTTSDWRSKIPGMSNLQQVKMAKQAASIAKAMIQEMGADATAKDIAEKVSRAEKLKVALASESTVEEVNVMIQQLQSVDIMHRIIRKRKIEGKSLPTNESSMKNLMQVDGLQAMTKTQKKAMRDSQMKKGMRGVGRARR